MPSTCVRSAPARAAHNIASKYPAHHTYPYTSVPSHDHESCGDQDPPVSRGRGSPQGPFGPRSFHYIGKENPPGVHDHIYQNVILVAPASATRSPEPGGRARARRLTFTGGGGRPAAAPAGRLRGRGAGDGGRGGGGRGRDRRGPPQPLWHPAPRARFAVKVPYYFKSVTMFFLCTRT